LHGAWPARILAESLVSSQSGTPDAYAKNIHAQRSRNDAFSAQDPVYPKALHREVDNGTLPDEEIV